ncbi:uncharacterized protein [Nicotiana tomentosiformis]|uniref:uncharacterized protein n=1 Tax=Nicotiana tomentosiformis TaxID=4098 RepID=UPI00388C7BC6
MYCDLKAHYWWRRMKKDIVGHVSLCLNCQQVKYEHQRPVGLLQALDIPEWKWEHIIMDFVCRSSVGWFDPGDARLLGTYLVRDASEMVKFIHRQLHTMRYRQKTNADGRVCDVACMVGEMVLLRVSPVKDMMRFWKKSKLSPRFIGPFEVLERVGKMAYKLALPPS